MQSATMMRYTCTSIVRWIDGHFDVQNFMSVLP